MSNCCVANGRSRLIAPTTRDFPRLSLRFAQKKELRTSGSAFLPRRIPRRSNAADYQGRQPKRGPPFQAISRFRTRPTPVTVERGRPFDMASIVDLASGLILAMTVAFISLVGRSCASRRAWANRTAALGRTSKAVLEVFSIKAPPAEPTAFSELFNPFRLVERIVAERKEDDVVVWVQACVDRASSATPGMTVAPENRLSCTYSYCKPTRARPRSPL